MQFKLKKTYFNIIIPILFFAGLAFLVDQTIKKIIFMRFIFSNDPIKIFPFFKLELIYNYGVSFSFLTGLNTKLIVFISTAALLALITIFYLIFDFKKPRIKLAVGLIIGAAFGNIVDRITFGAVIDFLDFHIKQYNFPIFNFADIFITFSAIILIIDLYSARRKN